MHDILLNSIYELTSTSIEFLSPVAKGVGSQVINIAKSITSDSYSFTLSALRHFEVAEVIDEGISSTIQATQFNAHMDLSCKGKEYIGMKVRASRIAVYPCDNLLSYLEGGQLGPMFDYFSTPPTTPTGNSEMSMVTPDSNYYGSPGSVFSAAGDIQNHPIFAEVERPISNVEEYVKMYIHTYK